MADHIVIRRHASLGNSLCRDAEREIWKNGWLEDPLRSDDRYAAAFELESSLKQHAGQNVSTCAARL
jgi:hypothetical protein